MSAATEGSASLVVCGAHLSGQPLNPFLLGLGAVLAGRARTAPVYRMYALPGGPAAPPRPGLVRQPRGGAALDVEVYDLPVAALGPLLVSLVPPLAVGRVLLGDGREPLGFVCEPWAVADADEITASGGWLNYLRAGTRS